MKQQQRFPPTAFPSTTIRTSWRRRTLAWPQHCTPSACDTFGATASRWTNGRGFSDLPPDHPHAKAIATAYVYGLVQGNPDGTFRPDDPINRAEVAKLVALLLKLRE